VGVVVQPQAEELSFDDCEGDVVGDLQSHHLSGRLGEAQGGVGDGGRLGEGGGERHDVSKGMSNRVRIRSSRQSAIPSVRRAFGWLPASACAINGTSMEMKFREQPIKIIPRAKTEAIP